jgi:hydrogenase expression/formation protein HypC
MCLAIPMQVTAVDGYLARCSARGVEREVSLFLLQDQAVAVGDCVLVHVGYAIQKTTPEEARSAWELYDQILAAEDTARDA